MFDGSDIATDGLKLWFRDRSTPAANPAASPISPDMLGGRYKPLTDLEILRIHALALQLLPEPGLSQVTPRLEVRAGDDWLQGGEAGDQGFPAALVEDVIAKSRRQFTRHGV